MSYGEFKYNWRKAQRIIEWAKVSVIFLRCNLGYTEITILKPTYQKDVLYFLQLLQTNNGFCMIARYILYMGVNILGFPIYSMVTLSRGWQV